MRASLEPTCFLDSPDETVTIRPFKVAVVKVELARLRRYRASSMCVLQSSQNNAGRIAIAASVNAITDSVVLFYAEYMNRFLFGAHHIPCKY